MHIEVNSNDTIDTDDELHREVMSSVEDALGRFAADITRVEVHLSDENRDKGGADDLRCLIEARLSGHPPTAVSHKAATLEQAIEGAADKAQRALASLLGKLRDP